jgi:hypothetical protein
VVPVGVLRGVCGKYSVANRSTEDLTQGDQAGVDRAAAELSLSVEVSQVLLNLRASDLSKLEVPKCGHQAMAEMDLVVAVRGRFDARTLRLEPPTCRGAERLSAGCLVLPSVDGR